MIPRSELPKYVLDREGKQRGTVTGGQRLCTLESCRGMKIAVRWPNKKITYPCSKGMKEIGGNTWQIM